MLERVWRKGNPSYTVDGNVNWYSQLWKTVWRLLKKLKIELPYDPAIPLMGTYPEKTIIRNDTCNPMFTGALFTIARTWKQPKCPSTNEWIKKMWYIYTMEYYSVIKKRNNAIFSDMDGPRNCHMCEVRERQISYDIAYMWNLKKWYKWTYLQNRNRVTNVENKLMVTRGESGGRDKLEVWD